MHTKRSVLSALILGVGLSAYANISLADSPDPSTLVSARQHHAQKTHLKVALKNTHGSKAHSSSDPSTAGIVVPKGMPPIDPHTPIYSVDAKPGVSFDDVKQGLEMAAEEKNMNIVNKLNIQQGMKGRGFTAKEPFMIFEVCNLGAGSEILKAAPEFSAFAPCKIVVYGEKGKLKLLTYRPTYALKYLKNFPESTRKIATGIENDILYIMAKAKNGSF